MDLMPCTQSDVRPSSVRRLALWAGLAVLASTAMAGKPRITLSEEVWNFGTIWHGEKVRHDVILRNEGDAELRIHKVKASCGCTAGSARKSVLAPGESTTFELSFDSHQKTNQISTEATIFSNDPDRPQVKVFVKGYVNRELAYDPLGGCFVRTLNSTEPATARCTVTNMTLDQVMNLQVLKVNSPKFDVSVKELEPGKKFEVVAVAKPPFQTGRTVGTVELATGLQREQTLSLPLSVEVLEKITISPPAIMLDADTVKAPVTRPATMMYYGTRPDWKIISAESSFPGVRVKVSPPRPPDPDFARLKPPPTLMASVSIEAPAAAELPPEGVTVTIHTDEPGYEAMKFRVISNSQEFQQIIQRIKSGNQ
jgi:hypothetical protein